MSNKKPKNKKDRARQNSDVLTVLSDEKLNINIWKKIEEKECSPSLPGPYLLDYELSSRREYLSTEVKGHQYSCIFSV